MADYADISMLMTLRALGAVLFDTHYNPLNDTWSAIDKARLHEEAIIGSGKTKLEAINDLLDKKELENERLGRARLG